MPESPTGLQRRRGHTRYSLKLGPQGVATRDLLLDALEDALDDTAWSRIAVIRLCDAVGRKPSSFYQYFPDLEGAFDALMARLAEQGRDPSEHMRLVAALLAFERKRVRRG